MLSVFLNHTFLLLSWFAGVPEKSPVVNNLHPFYVSVIEVQENTKDKTLEFSFKCFTDDFEKTINTAYKTSLDITSEKSRPSFDKLIPDYIQKHFAIDADGRPLKLIYVGYEIEKESVYCYFESAHVSHSKKLDIQTDLLYDLTRDQINIIHATINGKRQSTKMSFPQTKATLTF